MADSPGILSGPEPRRPPSHKVLGTVAAAASVAIHVLLVALFPPLPYARILRLPERPVRPPVEVGKVVTRPPPPGAPPETRFRPENPAELSEVYGRPEIARDALAFPAEVPDPPDLKTGPLKGESAALAEPASDRPPRAWEPRQQILAIQDRIFADEVSALPRQFVEKVERVDRAPDVTFDVLSTQDLSGGPSGGDGDDGLSVARLLPRAVGDGMRAAGPGGTAPPAGPMRDDLRPDSSLLDETPADITPIQAAESFLALELSTFDPPEEPGIRYFELRVVRKSESLLPVLPKDVLFIQDCSASMTPWKLQYCKAGLRLCLERLGPKDRFNIIRFDSAPTRCFADWAPADSTSRRRALAFIDDMRAAGDTDVYASLEAARSTEVSAERPLIAILVTDGRPTAGVTDTAEIIERFTRACAGRISMFAHTGGFRVNRFLVDMLAFRNRGDSRWVTGEEDIPSSIEKLATDIARPVLWELGSQFSGVSDDEVYPRTLSNLYLDMPLVLYGRIHGAAPASAVQIVGRTGASRRDVVFPLEWSTARPGGEEIRRRWAWHRIYELLSRHIGGREPGALAEVRALAERFNLPVPYGQDIPSR